MSTGLKKIVKLYDSVDSLKETNTKDGKRQKDSGIMDNKKPQSSKKNKLSAASSGRQLSLSSFFKTAKEECC